MRIKTIKIKNYKAFYGDYEIKLNRKNLIVYGENGSGKSSLYNALSSFFSASLNDIELEENIFLRDSQKDSSYIELIFDDINDASKNENIKIDKTIKKTNSITVSDANKTKAFFDYKKLLKTHFIDKDKVDVFDILINDILYHSINSFTGNPLGSEWEEINRLKNSKKGTGDFTQCESLLVDFNRGLKEKLVSIKEKTNEFIRFFNNNVILNFEFTDIVIYGKEKALINNQVILKVDFFDKNIDHHHTFFNEARLTALGISLYLASILSNPLEIKFKILVLDDLLIGLDMSNRIPFINIINEYFSDFQTIITTYDKAWFEVLKTYLVDWQHIEMYPKKLQDDNFEIPVIYQDGLDFIAKAEIYLNANDHKASAVYVRSEFEKIIKTYCDRHHLKVKYDKQPHKVDSNSFWESIKDNTDILETLVTKVELHRSLVMNPFSHHTIEKPEFKAELIEAIATIKELREELKKIKYKNPTKKLEEEIISLKKIIDECKQGIVVQSSIKIDFEKDVYLKLASITTTQEINEFLKSVIYEHIQKFDLNELERFFDEMRLAQKISLFNLDTEASFVRIFTKNEWNYHQQKIWCSFVQYLYNQGKVNEPMLIQKLEEKNCLKQQWHYDEYSIECDFIDKPSVHVSLPEIDINEDEIPF